MFLPQVHPRSPFPQAITQRQPFPVSTFFFFRDPFVFEGRNTKCMVTTSKVFPSITLVRRSALPPHDTLSAQWSLDGILPRSWPWFDVVGSPRTVCPSSNTLPAMMIFTSSFRGATYPSPVALSTSARSPLGLLSTSWSRCRGWKSTVHRPPRTFLGTHLFQECLLEIHHLRIVSKRTRSHVFASCCVAKAHVHPSNVDATSRG